MIYYIIIIGFIFVIASVIWFALDLRKAKTLMFKSEKEKGELRSIISDAEAMADELNKYSDFILDKIERKNKEAGECLESLNEAMNEANNKISLIRGAATSTIEGETAGSGAARDETARGETAGSEAIGDGTAWREAVKAVTADDSVTAGTSADEVNANATTADDTSDSPVIIGEAVNSAANVGDVVDSPVTISEAVGSPIVIGETLDSAANVGDVVDSPIIIGEAVGSPIVIGETLEPADIVDDASAETGFKPRFNGRRYKSKRINRYIDLKLEQPAGSAADDPAPRPLLQYADGKNRKYGYQRYNSMMSGNRKYMEILRRSEEGMTETEIARTMGIGKGEVALILGLRGDGYKEQLAQTM